MGRVYTPEELSSGSFFDGGLSLSSTPKRVMQKMQLLQNELGEDAVECMVHGSFAEGTANCRSDLDFIAVVPDRVAIGGAGFIRRSLSSEHARNNVLVEYSVLTQHQAQNGAHDIGPMFGSYLAEAQGSSPYVIGRPIDQIAIPNIDFLTDFASYVQRKHRGFCQVEDNFRTSTDWHVYQRALELPKKLKHKFKQLGVAGIASTSIEDSDAYSSLAEADREMTQLTEETIDRLIVGNGYDKALADYESYCKDRYRDSVKVAIELCESAEYKLSKIE